MTEVIRKKKVRSEEEIREEIKQAEVQKKGEKLVSETDDLIDEIDEVLEENAEEFVKNYIQRGGE